VILSLTKIPSTQELREIIIELLKKENLDDACYVDMLNYALGLFNEQNLKNRYYGYHNTSHEMIVTYNTLLASRGKEFQGTVSKEDFKHLFTASLFHDYEPGKIEDKPHEESAANFVTQDKKLLNLFKESEIDSHLVASLILRTSYPWSLKKSEYEPLILSHFVQSKYAHNKTMQEHYANLGWFMSVADRIGAYALGDFLDAMELAKKNAHSLGWDPEYIIQRSVTYFETLLNEEQEMTDKVMRSIPKPMRKTFMNNVLGFFKLREKELEVRASIVYDEIKLITNLEKCEFDDKQANSLFDIYDELPDPLQFKKKTFFESLKDSKTILITLRLGSDTGEILGFAKGGPLESYGLPDSINDKNYGKSNTVFLEPLALKMGYWGQGGGSQMRQHFRKIAKEKGYDFLTSLQLREVIQRRIERNDSIEFVQQLNPEKLDYYRVIL